MRIISSPADTRNSRRGLALNEAWKWNPSFIAHCRENFLWGGKPWQIVWQWRCDRESLEHECWSHGEAGFPATTNCVFWKIIAPHMSFVSWEPKHFWQSVPGQLPLLRTCWLFPISFRRRVSRFEGISDKDGALLFLPCSHKMPLLIWGQVSVRFSKKTSLRLAGFLRDSGSSLKPFWLRLRECWAWRSHAAACSRLLPAALRLASPSLVCWNAAVVWAVICSENWWLRQWTSACRCAGVSLTAIPSPYYGIVCCCARRRRWPIRHASCCGHLHWLEFVETLLRAKILQRPNVGPLDQWLGRACTTHPLLIQSYIWTYPDVAEHVALIKWNPTSCMQYAGLASL